MPTAPSPPPEPRASATEENKRRCPGNDWGVPRPSFAWAGSAARKLAQHEVLGTTGGVPRPSFAWVGSAARKLAQHEVLGTTGGCPVQALLGRDRQRGS